MAQYQANPGAIASSLLSCFRSPSRESQPRYEPVASPNGNCVFCEVVTDPTKFKITYEDSKFAVFADRSPGSDVHLLLIPKRHIGNVKDLKRKDVPMVREMARIGTEVLESLDVPIENQRLGFHIPPFYSINHLHLHLLSLPIKTRGNRLKYGPSIPSPSSLNSAREKIKGWSWFAEVTQVIRILENDGRVKIGSCYIDREIQTVEAREV